MNFEIEILFEKNYLILRAIMIILIIIIQIIIERQMEKTKTKTKKKVFNFERIQNSEYQVCMVIMTSLVSVIIIIPSIGTKKSSLFSFQKSILRLCLFVTISYSWENKQTNKHYSITTTTTGEKNYVNRNFKINFSTKKKVSKKLPLLLKWFAKT